MYISLEMETSGATPLSVSNNTRVRMTATLKSPLRRSTGSRVDTGVAKQERLELMSKSFSRECFSVLNLGQPLEYFWPVAGKSQENRTTRYKGYGQSQENRRKIARPGTRVMASLIRFLIFFIFFQTIS